MRKPRSCNSPPTANTSLRWESHFAEENFVLFGMARGVFTFGGHQPSRNLMPIRSRNREAHGREGFPGRGVGATISVSEVHLACRARDGPDLGGVRNLKSV